MIVVTIIFVIVFGVIMFGISNQLYGIVFQLLRIGDRLQGIEDTLDNMHKTQKTRF